MKQVMYWTLGVPLAAIMALFLLRLMQVSL